MEWDPVLKHVAAPVILRNRSQEWFAFKVTAVSIRFCSFIRSHIRCSLVTQIDYRYDVHVQYTDTY